MLEPSHKLGTCRLPSLVIIKTSSMHNMFGASVSEVYNIIRCQFDLKIEVIADGYLVAALSKEVCSSCWKQGGEGHKYPSVVNSLIGAPPMVGHILKGVR